MKKLVVVALISLFVMACGKHATDTQTDRLQEIADHVTLKWTARRETHT